MCSYLWASLVPQIYIYILIEGRIGPALLKKAQEQAGDTGFTSEFKEKGNYKPKD
jgi:hypothetical protein